MNGQVESAWVEASVVGEARPMLAYLARPAHPGPRPAVLVGFEMFGITRYVRRVAERLAGAGYLAVVPDFYHRQGARIELPADEGGRQRGLGLLHELTREGVRADLQAVQEHLRGRPGHDGRVAMLGLSVGGHIAYYAATQVPLAALVVFYPGWLTGTDIPLSRPEPTLTLTPRIAQMGTPVLFLVGEDDRLITEQQRDQIGLALRRAGGRAELVTYPDTPHGFLCDERDAYRPAAAADAWDRTIALLNAEMAARG